MRALAMLPAAVVLSVTASAQTRVVSTLVTSSQQGCIAEPKGDSAPNEPRFCACDDGSCRKTARYLTELALGASSADLERAAWSSVEALAAQNDDAGRPLRDVLGALSRNYYRLVWKGLDAEGKAVVYQLLLHDGGRPQPANVLPGIKGASGTRLYDILVTDITTVQHVVADRAVERESPLDTLSSVYVSTHVDNPLLAQLPEFIAKTNVLQFWAKAMGPGGVKALAPGEEPKKRPLYGTRFTIYRVDLPEGRATVQVTDQVVTRLPDVDAVIANAESLAARLARPEAKTSACVVHLAGAYVEALTLAAPACRAADPVTLEHTREAARDCQDTLNRVLRETTDQARKAKACTTSDGWNEDVTAAQLRFKSLVDAVGENCVTAKSRLENEPKTWISLGVAAATTVGEPHVADGYVRATLDGHVYAADPMPRLLTAVVVNLHPWPYQASAQRQSWRERLRTFAGVTITPDFGLAAGIGCSVVRGLSVNAGAAVMWTNAVRADQVGEPIPDSANKNRPFALKTAVVGLFGLSYVFK